MNRLFIELYLDEDVDVLIAGLAVARGFKASTTQESGNTGVRDEQQLAYAVRSQKTLLTHNRVDFERLAEAYYAAGREHYGIIIALRRSPYEVMRRLLVILNSVTAGEMKNQLRYI